MYNIHYNQNTLEFFLDFNWTNNFSLLETILRSKKKNIKFGNNIILKELCEYHKI